MKRIPNIYIYNGVVSNVTIHDEYANYTATATIIDVVSYPDGSGGSVQETYDCGVLTGATGIDESGNTLYNVILNGSSVWLAVTPVAVKNVSAEYINKASNQLNQLIKKQRQLLEDLLLASEYVAMLESRGYDCSTYRQKITSLYKRYAKRNEDIALYTDNRQMVYPRLISNNLSDIVNANPTIAIGITITTAIVATAVVAVSFASLAWWAFYNCNMEATSDCRESTELNRLLANVDPSVREKIYNWIDDYADDFYKNAVRRERQSGIFSTIRNIALVAGGGYIMYKLLNNSKN